MLLNLLNYAKIWASMCRKCESFSFLNILKKQMHGCVFVRSRSYLKCVVNIFILTASLISFGHGSWKTHLADVECVLNGYGEDPAFRELFSATSTGQDDMAKAYYSEFSDIMTKNFNPKRHRLLGHGWPLNGKIPKEYLDILETEYGVPRKKTIAFWRRYQKNIIAKAMKATGLPKQQATAFAGLIWDLHLIGDLEPDNTVIKQVMKIDTILDNMESHLKTLFKNKPEYADVVMRRLRRVITDCQNQGIVDVKIVARRLMDELQQTKLGTMIHSVWKDKIKLKWSLDKSINAMAWFKERTKARVVEKIDDTSKSLCKKFSSRMASKKEAAIYTKSGTSVTEKQTSKALVKQCSKNGKNTIKTTKGVLQKLVTKSGNEYIVLSVHIPQSLGAGIGAGVLTFIVDEGVTAISYANGNISTDEFQVETAKNIGGAIVAGAAAYVTVAFCLAPAGPIAIAIGVAGYMIYDIAFDMIYDANKYRGIEFEELFGMFPTEMQRSKGEYAFDEVVKLFGYKGVSKGFEYEGRSKGFEYEGRSQGFEFKRQRKDKRPFEL